MIKFVIKIVTSTFSVLTTFSDLLFPSEKLSSAPQLLGRANMRLSQLHNKTKQTIWLGLKNKKLRSPISHRQIIIWVVSSLVFMGCSDLYLDIVIMSDLQMFWSKYFHNFWSKYLAGKSQAVTEPDWSWRLNTLTVLSRLASPSLGTISLSFFLSLSFSRFINFLEFL